MICGEFVLGVLSVETPSPRALSEITILFEKAKNIQRIIQFDYVFAELEFGHGISFFNLI